MNPSATKPKASTTTSAQAAPIPKLVPNIQAARHIDYNSAVYEVKQYRRLSSRAASRRHIRTSTGEEYTERNRCLVSGLPLEHGQPIRVWLLVRDEFNHDGDPRCYRQVERWQPVGLPLRSRHRAGEDGFFPPTKDVAWHTLREQFKVRTGVRLRHGDLQEQLVFNARLPHPEARFGEREPLAVFDFAFIHEEAYRWLVEMVGRQLNEHGESLRTADLGYVRRWARAFKASQFRGYRPDRPFRESHDIDDELGGIENAMMGIKPEHHTTDWNCTVGECCAPCSSSLRWPFGAVGLGPVMHQILRGNGAATRALCDANLCALGLGLLRQPLRPTWRSTSFSNRFSVSMEAGQHNDLAWLLRQRANWLLRQPVAKPVTGLVR